MDKLTEAILLGTTGLFKIQYISLYEKFNELVVVSLY